MKPDNKNLLAKFSENTLNNNLEDSDSSQDEDYVCDVCTSEGFC